MRILLVSPLPPPIGGMASWTKSFINHADDYNYVLNVVNTSLVGARSKNINNKTSIKDEFRRTNIVIRKIKKSIKNGIDIAHINSSGTKFGVVRDALIVFICKTKNIPVVIEFHSNVEYQIGNSFLPKLFLGFILKRANKVLVLNGFSKDFLSRINKQTSIDVLPNFIDDKRLNKKIVRKECDKALFVGHIKKEKGIFEIIECANKRKDIDFELFGKVDESIDLSNLPSNINLHGEVEQAKIIETMDMADFLFFPSYSEGFSMVVLESMARGLPVITTNVGANMDMLENLGGIVVDSPKTELLIRAIDTIMPFETRKKMSEWLFSKVANNYVSSVVLNQLNNAYLEVLGCESDDDAK